RAVAVSLGGVEDETGIAEALGARPVGHLLEGEQPDPPVDPGGADRELTGHARSRPRLGVENRADGEATLRLVSVQLHGDLPVQAVRLADPGQHDRALSHGGILSPLDGLDARPRPRVDREWVARWAGRRSGLGVGPAAYDA